jgi:hypothetical protein
MGAPVTFVDVIARDMGMLPVATRKALRPKLIKAGDAVVQGAKSRSAWSSRIPGTIRATASFALDREGVTVRAGGSSTPHARPFEDVAGRGFFRHPVFAHAWVRQTSRPFLLPAAQAGAEQTTAALMSALDEAAATLGFGGSS